MGKLLGLTWSAVTHVVSVDAVRSFYFRDKVTEQNFAILLRHLAIIIIIPFLGGGGVSNLVTWGKGKFACITMCFDGNTLKSSWKFFNCFL